MSCTHPRKEEPGRTVNSPTAWFAALDRARRTSDFELAAKALKELRRLGVCVKFKRAMVDGDDGTNVTGGGV